MIVKLTWNSMKTIIDANRSVDFFYSTENEYDSNEPEIVQIFRYFVRQTIGSDENHCLIIKDGGPDQIEFELDYMTRTQAFEAN